MPEKKPSLCHRCEYRAQAHETGFGPRCECKSFDMSVGSCYMYLPVHPAWLIPNQGETRLLLAGALISGRASISGVGEMFCIARRKDGAIMKVSGPNINDCDFIHFVNDTNAKVVDLIIRTFKEKREQKEEAKKIAKKAVKAEAKKTTKKVVKVEVKKPTKKAPK